jgi:hypothetical protein
MDNDGEEPGVPSDNTTLRAVLRIFEDAGFDEQLIVIEDADGRVQCAQCGSVSGPDRIIIRSLRRLEGASDPADMLAVIAAECPVCRAKGTIVTHFGPGASTAETALLLRAHDERKQPEVGPTERGTR